jgi:hypothetical protein
MSSTRKWGVGLLVGSVALWLAVVVAVVLTPVDEGANIGAGMLFMLAVPCTVTGLALFLTGRPGRQQAPWGPAPAQYPHPGGTLLAAPVAPPFVGNGPAGWGLGLAITGFVLSWTPIGSETAYFVIVLVAAALGLAGAGLGGVGLRRVGEGRAGRRELALAAVIVGLAGAGLQVFVVLEAVLFFLGVLP